MGKTYRSKSDLTGIPPSVRIYLMSSGQFHLSWAFRDHKQNVFMLYRPMVVEAIING